MPPYALWQIVEMTHDAATVVANVGYVAASLDDDYAVLNLILQLQRSSPPPSVSNRENSVKFVQLRGVTSAEGDGSMSALLPLGFGRPIEHLTIG